jgi:dihydrofolate reductase
MRKLVTAAFVSLDGVMQAPGGREEDPSGGFRYGGWTVPYADGTFGRGTAENFGRPFDLLLGRRTYDIWAGFWPDVDVDPSSPRYSAGMADIANSFNRATKYVASRSRSAFDWQPSQWLGPDTAAAVRALKQGDGPDLLTQGSSDLVQTLLAEDLVDEIRLLIYPVVLGAGKKLLGTGTRPAAFRQTRSETSPTGVILAIYERDGEVRTGSFGPDGKPEA